MRLIVMEQNVYFRIIVLSILDYCCVSLVSLENLDCRVLPQILDGFMFLFEDILGGPLCSVDDIPNLDARPFYDLWVRL